MDIILNPMFLPAFTTGTILGASSMLLFSKYRSKKLLTNCKCELACPFPKNRSYEDGPPPPIPEGEDEYRLVVGIRNDLKMQKGKVAAQVGHASIAAYRNANRELINKWLIYGGTKITVKVDSEKDLLDLEKTALANNVLASIVRDAGQTQVEPGARTVIAIGPAPKTVLDKISGHLKLY